MRFAIREAEFCPYSPGKTGHPYFKLRGRKTFKWCATLAEAHIFENWSEVPLRKRRYRLVIM